MIGGGRRDLYERAAACPQRQSPLPSSFSTLTEARESFIFIWHKCTYMINDIRNRPFQNSKAEYETQQKRCFTLVEQWSSALDALLLARSQDMTPLELKGASVLKIQKLIGFAILHTHRSGNDDQTLWDPLCPMFEQVVNLAAEVLDLDTEINNSSPSETRTPSFLFDMEIVGPLYHVASRCRDPVIRRKAIALLKASSRDEGLWNSFLTAKVAERGMQVEEEGLGTVKCCADVPDWARISHVKPVFDPIGRKVTLKYSRAGSASS